MSDVEATGWVKVVFENSDGAQLTLKTSKEEWESLSMIGVKGELEIQYPGGSFRGRVVSVEPCAFEAINLGPL